MDEHELLPLTVEEESALLSAMFDRSPYGMLFVDPEITIRAANESCARQTGVPMGNLVGFPLGAALPGWKDRLVPICREIQTTGEPYKAEAFALVAPGGREQDIVYWDLSISPIYGTDGVFLGCLILHQEVTERKRQQDDRERLLERLRDLNRDLAAGSIRARYQTARAQQTAAELDSILEAITDGVIIYGPAGEILRLNPAAQQMLGYTPEQRELPLEERTALLRLETAEGRPFPIDELPVLRALRGEIVRGTLIGVHPSVEETGAAKNGAVRWVACSASPIRGPEGSAPVAVATFTDITSFQQLRLQREESIQMISHDLRNPLTIATTQAEILVRRLRRQGLAQEAESAEAILESNQRMNAMITDLVQAALPGKAAPRRVSVDLTQLVGDIVERMGATGGGARLRMEASGDVPEVQADPVRLERAIVNLVSNALKFSPPDRPVVVRVGESDGEAIVAVADQGVGIAPEDVRHLFRRFYRGRSGRQHEGLGLGLYIARQIVEEHGGNIWARSQPGRGSTFYISLPPA